MIADAFGLIYTGEDNLRLRELTQSRSVAAVPFGGRYRCIDFILSDLVNSGVTSVGLITQKNYHSLMDHLGSGKEWDLHRKREGLFIIPPFMTKENTGLYRGSVDAFKASIGFVRRCPQEYIILTGSHTIFNMTFNDMLRQHIETGADITLLYSDSERHDPEDPYKDLRFDVEEDGRITNVELNPFRPINCHRNAGVMIMRKQTFIEMVESAFARGDVSFVRDVLVRHSGAYKIYGYCHKGFIASLTSVKAFFDANMALLEPEVREDLFNPEHPIYTKVKDETSAKYGEGARVANSMLADGCYIKGKVENSILFRGVTVKEGALVRNSIIMQGVEIGEGCAAEHVIIDKGAKLRDGRTLIGYDSFPVIVKKNTVV